MTDFQLRLSVQGKDVQKGVRDELIIDDSRTHLKVQTNQTPPHAGIISLIITGTVSYSSKTILYQFPHGYKHRPTVQGVVQRIIAGQVLTGMLPFDPPAYILNLEADETNVYLYIAPQAGVYVPTPQTFTIRYQVYVDEAA